LVEGVGSTLEKRLFHLDVDRSKQGGASDPPPDRVVNINGQVLDMVSDLHDRWNELCRCPTVEGRTRYRFERIRDEAEGFAGKVRHWFRTTSASSATTPRPADPLSHDP
jgi:hypothetical protein